MVRRRLPSHAKSGFHNVNADQRRKRKSKTGARKASKKTPLLIKKSLLLLSLAFGLMLVILLYRLHMHRVWKGTDRINFALQVPDSPSQTGVYLVSYLSSRKDLTIVSFTEGTKVEAVEGFGPWRIESLFPLGEMDERGGELLTDSLSEFFGIEIAGWLVLFEGEYAMQPDSVRSDLRRLLGQAFLRKGSTNFGFLDILILWLDISAVRLGNVEWTSLSEQGVLREITQPDGSLAFYADLELLDRLSRQHFSHPEILNEDMAISVLNATDSRGLGARVARKVRNMGGNVVSVADYSRGQEETTVTVGSRELLDSFTASAISRVFSAQLRVGETGEQRAEIILVVGDDYLKDLTES